MTDDEDWICQCRQCHGVHTAADAVQYVWEFALGSCDVPIVVGVNADDDGFACCAFTYWHDEPQQPYPIGELGEFIVRADFRAASRCRRPPRPPPTGRR